MVILMKDISFDDDMKRHEVFSNNEVPPNSFFAIRVDGRNFHTEVKRLGLERPLDRKLRDAIVEASIEVMKDFGIDYAYTESDEVTFIFTNKYTNYLRRAEKLATLVASKMSVSFNRTELIRNSQISPIFDGRVLVLPTQEDVERCLKWRLYDSKRNCISTYCFWTLVKKGVKEGSAQKMLNGKKDSEKKAILKGHDIDYSDCKDWEKFGTIIKAENYEKEGFNPMTKEKVMAIRKKYEVYDVEITDVKI